MYLWQDHGHLRRVRPRRRAGAARCNGAEPGGVKGIVCDVIPDGMDIVGWFGVGFIVILFTGFYLWYWPGVKRWANALRIQRGRGRVHVQHVAAQGDRVPRLDTADRRSRSPAIAFAFPNLEHVVRERHARGARLLPLGRRPSRSRSRRRRPGASRSTLDDFVDDRRGALPRPRRSTTSTRRSTRPASYSAWVTRGFDPWTREGGAGNTYVFVDQYTGEIVYDGTPEDGNVFDQAWDDWSFPLHTGDCGGPITRGAVVRHRPVADRPRRHRRRPCGWCDGKQAGEAGRRAGAERPNRSRCDEERASRSPSTPRTARGRPSRRRAAVARASWRAALRCLFIYVVLPGLAPAARVAWSGRAAGACSALYALGMRRLGAGGAAASATDGAHRRRRARRTASCCSTC